MKGQTDMNEVKKARTRLEIQGSMNNSRKGNEQMLNDKETIYLADTVIREIV